MQTLDSEDLELRLSRLTFSKSALTLARHDTEDDAMVALLDGQGRVRVFRLSKATSTTGDTSATLTDEALELASYDPFTELITGGDSCRYCVERCPEGW